METKVVSVLRPNYGCRIYRKRIPKSWNRLWVCRPINRWSAPSCLTEYQDGQTGLFPTYGYTPVLKYIRYSPIYHQTQQGCLWCVYGRDERCATTTYSPDCLILMAEDVSSATYRPYRSFTVSTSSSLRREDHFQRRRWNDIPTRWYACARRLPCRSRRSTVWNRWLPVTVFDISPTPPTTPKLYSGCISVCLAAVSYRERCWRWSVGRVSTFLDIYMFRDPAETVWSYRGSGAGTHRPYLVMKFHAGPSLPTPPLQRTVLQATLSEFYSKWAASVQDGRSIINQNDYRFYHHARTWDRLPNRTLPYCTVHVCETFKKWLSKISVVTEQYPVWRWWCHAPCLGWRWCQSRICCVSATQTGKEMQFFGARLPIWPNVCCMPSMVVWMRKHVSSVPWIPSYHRRCTLKYEDVMPRLTRWWTGWRGVREHAQPHHYMHDKYFYRAAEMALIDTDVRRTFCYGYRILVMCGFSDAIKWHDRQTDSWRTGYRRL